MFIFAFVSAAVIVISINYDIRLRIRRCLLCCLLVFDRFEPTKHLIEDGLWFGRNVRDAIRVGRHFGECALNFFVSVTSGQLRCALVVIVYYLRKIKKEPRVLCL